MSEVIITSEERSKDIWEKETASGLHLTVEGSGHKKSSTFSFRTKYFANTIKLNGTQRILWTTEKNPPNAQCQQIAR